MGFLEVMCQQLAVPKVLAIPIAPGWLPQNVPQFLPMRAASRLCVQQNHSHFSNFREAEQSGQAGQALLSAPRRRYSQYLSKAASRFRVAASNTSGFCEQALRLAKCAKALGVVGPARERPRAGQERLCITLITRYLCAVIQMVDHVLALSLGKDFDGARRVGMSFASHETRKSVSYKAARPKRKT
jgi:hypothetical protein